MQESELAEKLKCMLSKGQDGDTGRHMFILFGIKYAAEIEACGKGARSRIAKAAHPTPKSSFGTEIGKGVRLAPHVRLRRA